MSSTTSRCETVFVANFKRKDPRFPSRKKGLWLNTSRCTRLMIIISKHIMKFWKLFAMSLGLNVVQDRQSKTPNFAIIAKTTLYSKKAT